jgi:hypothetical protein
MKWSTTVSFALAAGGVLALVALLTHESTQTAARFLESVEQRYAAGKLDRQQLLRELELAQAQAEHEGDGELAKRVQLRRGRLLLELGSWSSARGELEAVAAGGGPAQREIQLLRIELECRAGDAEAGLKLAADWLPAHPQDERAWELSGELHRMRSEALRDEALAGCTKELVPESAGRAQPWVRALSARPAHDPRRVALARDLRACFGAQLEAAAERVLVLCDRAAEEAAAAREGLGRSLELEFEPRALALLAELLEQAGLGEQALDLLTAASGRPALQSEERASAFLLHALVARERWRQAALVAENSLKTGSRNAEFLLDACRATHASLALPGSQPIRLFSQAFALLQVSTSELGALPWFYVGEAHFRMGTPEMLPYARSELEAFALSGCREPFPGARGQALRHMADCCRALGLASDERAALESATEVDPGGSGEAWLRLAELQLASPHGGYRAPDLCWARGMVLLPDRQAELLPRWLEIGALELRAVGLDPRSALQDMRSGRNVRPSSGAAPFELYTLAQANFEAGRIHETQALLQDLDEAVPGCVPAIDLRIELARKRERKNDLVQAFLERLEHAGYDQRTRALHAELPPDALSPGELRRVVRADPDLTGRLALARSFARRHERGPALRFLLQLPPEHLGPAERLRAAQLELESSAPESAYQRLDALGDELLPTKGALETWVDAGLRAGHGKELRDALPARISALPLDRVRFLALADRLLASGEAGLARLALQRLDQAGKQFRGGDVLWRIAACALSAGQPDAFARLLERADAFDTHGETELLKLLALPAEAEPGAVEVAAQALRKTGWKCSPLGKLALARLAGDPEADSAGKERPLLALLDDEAVHADAARTGAELLLALERPALGAWALARLAELGDAAGPVWPLWYRARLHRQAGEPESEERVLRELLAAQPGFGAAWDRLLELRADPADEGEGDLDLCLARAAALGEQAGSAAERDWTRSRGLEREGKLDEAFAAARLAANAAPDAGPIQRHLGRIAARLGRLRAAIVAYQRALQLLPARSGQRSAAEYLALLEEARSAQPPLLDAEAERAELDALGARLPDDPRVLLAQARNDLETSAADPAFGAARAEARLEHFRARIPGRSFEDLAAGSTEGWTRFLLELDPESARTFLESELERDPGNLEAWVLLPRCSTAAGDQAQALTEVAFLQRLAPGKESLLEYLRVRAQGDWNIEGITQIFERLRSIDPQFASAPSTLAVLLRAELELGPLGVQKALQVSLALAPAQLSGQPPDLRAEILWMQAVALLARGTGTDMAQARMRLAVLDTLVRDPARKPLLAALRGLARAIP